MGQDELREPGSTFKVTKCMKQDTESLGLGLALSWTFARGRSWTDGWGPQKCDNLLHSATITEQWIPSGSRHALINDSWLHFATFAVQTKPASIVVSHRIARTTVHLHSLLTRKIIGFVRELLIHVDGCRVFNVLCGPSLAEKVHTVVQQCYQLRGKVLLVHVALVRAATQ